MKIIKKINEKEINWEPAAHENPKDPGVWKKVVVNHEEVDPKSKLMMVNLCKVPVGRIHVAHSHDSMEEIFYFTQGSGEVKIDDEVVKVETGDRVIIPAKSVHQVKNTGNDELMYTGLGIALD